MTKKDREEDEGSCPWPWMIRSRFQFHGDGGLDTSHGLTWIRRHKLGQGAFASVYSATSTSNPPAFFVDGDGAISITPSELAVKSAEISKSSSLRSELEILSRLNSSSYVVQCYGNEITMSADGTLYYNLLMEKCCGGSLGSLIRNSGGVGLPEIEARRITRDVVGGLCYIHGRGYVHCDIKPDNILLVPSGCCDNSFRAKIGDLGLAKEAFYCDPADDEVLRGTLRYMSPELLAYNMQCWLSDIWALGCVVIEMISGKLVWSCQQPKGSNMVDLLRQIAFSPELPEFPSNISDNGRDFLEKCLDRNIDKRWSALMLLNHPFLISYDEPSLLRTSPITGYHHTENVERKY